MKEIGRLLERDTGQRRVEGDTETSQLQKYRQVTLSETETLSETAETETVSNRHGNNEAKG